MDSSQSIVIVGAGLAGSKASEELRKSGFEGKVIIIGNEPFRPYDRPPLSKEYLRGEKQFDEIAVHDDQFYSENNIDLLLSSEIVGVNPSKHVVTLSNTDTIHFDKLLLATGAEPRKLSVPGAQLDDVYYLRSIRDSDSLRQRLIQKPKVAVIGAGWIGAEVAASARQLGCEVSLIEMGSLPLERVLGSEIGEIYRKLHDDHGIDLHFSVGVDEILGSTQVQGVKLSNNSTVPAEVVVVGIGVSPRVELAEDAGIHVDNGIVVDEHLETSVPGIFAAGDVASAFHPRYGTHIRLEHWSAALNQGSAAAKGLLGNPVVYDRIPYFYSDQYDMGMEYRGYAPQYDEVVIRGDATQNQFIAFWLRHGRIRAAMNVNIWDQGKNLESIVKSDKIIEKSLLVDTNKNLDQLLSD